MWIQLLKERNIIVGSTKEKTIVDVTLLSRQCEFFLQCLKRSCLRHRIRHIKISGHTTSRCRTALGIDVGLLCQSWLTEVDMIIDDTRQYETSRSINELIRGCFGIGISLNNLCYLTVFDDDGTIERLALIDNGSTLDYGSHFWGRLVRGTCMESGSVCGG